MSISDLFPADVALLSPAQMSAADRMTIDGGTSGLLLMRRAGAAVAEAARKIFPNARAIAVLAGSGNNGGDAFVAAECLADKGSEVCVFLLRPRAEVSGDAGAAAAAWKGESRPLQAFEPDRFDLVIDGLFGAGLSRPATGEAAEAIRKLNASATPVVAIDLPSGISGADGKALGEAVEADVTVTFFRRKPGHLLQPGRAHCGRVVLADIGIATSVLDEIRPSIFANEPPLWRDVLLRPAAIDHKYDRGHAVVFSGGATQTGAARLSAAAALRGGAGLVTVFSPAAALLVNATHLTAIMLKRCEYPDDLASLLEDARLNAFVLGPGFGVGEKARNFAQAVLQAGRRLVLDADGITSFRDAPSTLFDLVRDTSGEIVLTPHDGEFKRLFPDLATHETLSKLDRASEAAKRSGAVVVLKGSDTVIASPDGRAAINATETPWLATAGTGDVLTGLIAAQLAQGVPTFEAAAAAVWIHGRAGQAFGPGLTAEDLPGLLPPILAELVAAQWK